MNFGTKGCMYCEGECNKECLPKKETLEEAAETWVNQRFTKQICGAESYPDIYASKESIVESHVIFAKWQQEQNRWKTVSEETPPSNIELLVQSPEGIVHLSSWRESYNIFCCQAKSESSYDWKWKTI